VINSPAVDTFPKIGTKPISSIEAPHMLEIMPAIKVRGVRETAKQVLPHFQAVFQYGIVTRSAKRTNACGEIYRPDEGNDRPR